MKFFGWLYIALLVAIQLIGWLGFGKVAACPALMVIVIPSSLLTGAVLFWFYYWNRSFIMMPPMVLLFIYLGVSDSPRTSPRSALLRHAMSQFFEREINGFESYLGVITLAISMFLIVTAASFCTAEFYRIYTGRRKGGGVAFIQDLLRYKRGEEAKK